MDQEKIIHFFPEVENEDPFSWSLSSNKLKIIIYNKYICISKNKGIYIYNISDYKLIKQISLHDFKIYNFDENMILIINKSYCEENEKIILYDLTDLNNIKYQKFNFDKIISNKNYMINCFGIKKLSDRKMIVIYKKNIFIIEYSK